MNGEYDRLRQLLLDQERDRLDALQADLRESGDRVPERVADDIERGLASGRPTRLTSALAEATVSGLEQAVQRKPETVVNAVFPVIGPAIRRSIQEAMRQLSADIDRAVNNALSPQSLKWRIEAWRSGMPYAQVVLRHTASWRVEHLFLIQPESGLLLGHLTASGLPELDADAVAGMFTAIQQFVRDSVSADEAQGGIGSAVVGDYRLEVSEGPQARLVAFVRGVPPGDFAVRLDELNEALHARHGATLATGEGVGAAGAGLFERAQLDALNARDETASAAAPESNATRYLLWGLLAVAIALLAWWAIASWRWSRQVDEIRQHLSAMPGVAVTQFDAGERGALRIEGLRDPAADDPQAWLAKTYPQIEAQWKLRGFMSLEPELAAARAAQALGLPKENIVFPPDAQGVLKLRGEVPFATWHRFRHDPPTLAMAGVTGIDASELAYPQQAKVEALGAQLKRLTIPFASGAGVPDADAEAALARIVAGVRGLQALGGDDIAFGFRTAGLTDGAGSGEQNSELRRQRAEWLAGRLAAEVRAPSDVAVDQALAAEDAAIGQRGARVVAIPMPAKRDATR